MPPIRSGMQRCRIFENHCCKFFFWPLHPFRLDQKNEVLFCFVVVGCATANPACVILGVVLRVRLVYFWGSFGPALTRNARFWKSPSQNTWFLKKNVRICIFGVPPRTPRRVQTPIHKTEIIITFLGCPRGPQMDVQGHPKIRQNSSDTIDLLISFCIEFRWHFFACFCRLSGCPGALKCTKNVVLSFKIEGTTELQKSIFSRQMPSKIVPKMTFKTTRTQQKHFAEAFRKHARKKHENC